MSKILVFTPVWKRAEITEAYCLGISRLKKDFDLDCFCVVSPEDPTKNIDILDSYGIEYCYHENKLGAKKNHGLREALKKDFDYLMELNSDDIIFSELVATYQDLMDKDIPFIGLGNFAFYEASTGRAKHKKKGSTLFGIGRCYRKETLKEVSRCVNVEVKETFTTGANHFKRGTSRAIHPNDMVNHVSKLDQVSDEYHKLWDDGADYGMDNHSNQIFMARGVEANVVETREPKAFDIKSEVNIWSFEQMRGESYDGRKLLNGISDVEREYLLSLYKNK